MKYIKILTLLLFFPIMGLTQAVNTTFTYQGELIVNGSPANGTYDMSFDAYEVAAGGSSLLLFGADIHTNVTVTNGLFTVADVDFGNFIFTGGADTWIELAVKPTSSGSYNVLSPRQKITSSPYAIKSDFSNTATNATSALKANDLNISGASSGDVLAYNGVNWGSANALHVNGNGGASVGTSSVPPGNGLKVAGNTEIGPRGTQATADALLDINSTATGAQEDPLRVRKNGTIKFYVDSNGGASVGSWNTPAADGLTVKGNTQLDSELLVQGKMKQNFASKGMVKYMMSVSCNINNAIMNSSVNNTERTDAGTGLFAFNYVNVGTCGIEFPDVINIGTNYWTTSAITDNTTATCRISGTSSARPAMRCETRSTTNGALINADFMLIVY